MYTFTICSWSHHMDEISSCWYISSIWAAYFSLTTCRFTWKLWWDFLSEFKYGSMGDPHKNVCMEDKQYLAFFPNFRRLLLALLCRCRRRTPSSTLTPSSSKAKKNTTPAASHNTNSASTPDSSLNLIPASTITLPNTTSSPDSVSSDLLSTTNCAFPDTISSPDHSSNLLPDPFAFPDTTQSLDSSLATPSTTDSSSSCLNFDKNLKHKIPINHRNSK